MVLEYNLSEDDKQRIKDRNLILLLHHDSRNPEQSFSCPKIIWQGLGHGSGIGKWCCVLKENRYGDLLYGGGQENLEYLPCDCPDFHNCKTLVGFVENSNKPK